MKLTYYIADCIGDSSVYSIRAKTRKEVKAIIDSGEMYGPFGKIRKVVVEYKDGFDLVMLCLYGDDAGGFER